MNHQHVDAETKAIQQPDRTVRFLDGSVRVVMELLGTVAIGHGIYQPAGSGRSTSARQLAGPRRGTSGTC